MGDLAPEIVGVVAKRTGYQTSLAGLVGAMLLCLLLIVGYIGLRAFTREDLVTTPTALDYVPVVKQYQESGETVLYPRTLPDGWLATSLDNTPGQRPTFGLGFLTASTNGQFVGYKWADISPSSLVERAMGDDAREGERVTLDTPEFGSEWTEWTRNADVGYTVQYPATDGRTLLVWGTLEKKVMVDFINSLTTEKLD